MAISLALALCATVALITINEAGYSRSSRALETMAQAQQARFALNTLVQNILDAETGQRGYLLTGEDAYREPYDKAARQVDVHLAALAELYARATPAERGKVVQLADHVRRKLSEIQMSVDLRKSGKDDAWKFVITTDVGRDEMLAIRSISDDLVESSNLSILAGQAQVERTLLLSRLGIALVAVAGLLAFWLYLRQTRALRTSDELQQRALQRERNSLEREVRERTASLAELATHLQEVRETERGYLARELHDELGSLLTAAKLDVARLKSRLGSSPDAIQRLQHLTELLNSGIALKRRIIEDLRPSSLANLGLVASLEILAREFGERSGIKVHMSLDAVTLDDGRQLTIYRMVQESLTNIVKYAQASEVSIALRREATQVSVDVQDNGQGFDTARVRPSTHGLAGMRHRVETAGGTLTIESATGQGTHLRITLPVPAGPATAAVATPVPAGTMPPQADVVPAAAAPAAPASPAATHG